MLCSELIEMCQSKPESYISESVLCSLPSLWYIYGDTIKKEPSLNVAQYAYLSYGLAFSHDTSPEYAYGDLIV